MGHLKWLIDLSYDSVTKVVHMSTPLTLFLGKHVELNYDYKMVHDFHYIIQSAYRHRSILKKVLLETVTGADPDIKVSPVLFMTLLLTKQEYTPEYS